MFDFTPALIASSVLWSLAIRIDFLFDIVAIQLSKYCQTTVNVKYAKDVLNELRESVSLIRHQDIPEQ